MFDRPRKMLTKSGTPKFFLVTLLFIDLDQFLLVNSQMFSSLSIFDIICLLVHHPLRRRLARTIFPTPVQLVV